MSKKIYFCGSIRGGRRDRELYAQIIAICQRHGRVLTEHIAADDPDATQIALSGAAGSLSDAGIYKTDMHWLKECDVVIAEVTQTSLGVGVEIGAAIQMGKRVMCLWRPDGTNRLSAMVSGAHNGNDIQVVHYAEVGELEGKLDTFINTVG